jgi:hypothetical protein
MKIYYYRIPELPGALTVVAENEREASIIHRHWFERRFERRCEAFSMTKPTDAHLNTEIALSDALKAGVAGVASWSPQTGWIVTPPDMAMPGYHWRETRPVKCWELSSGEEHLLVFAPTPDDAKLLFSTWWTLHLGGAPGRVKMVAVDPDSFHKEQAGLIDAMNLGAIGIGSDLVGEWKIMMPYDPAAGDL